VFFGCDNLWKFFHKVLIFSSGLIPRPKWNLSLIDKDGGEEDYDGDFVFANLKLLKLKVEMPLLVTGKHI